MTDVLFGTRESASPAAPGGRCRRQRSRYGVVVRAVFLGFAISMIMAHAPTILPAVLRRPLPYTPLLISPAALLHASVALRLLVGDGYGVPAAWPAGGALNITALLLFVVLTGGRPQRPRRPPRRPARGRR